MTPAWVFTSAPAVNGRLLCMLQTKDHFLWCHATESTKMLALTRLLKEAESA